MTKETIKTDFVGYPDESVMYDYIIAKENDNGQTCMYVEKTTIHKRL